MKAKRKQLSGSAKMKAKGKKPSLVWMDPTDYALLKNAAEADGRSLANFILRSAVQAARKFHQIASDKAK